ncbi:MAG: hypothetical protein NVS3B25_09770 [Hymenobacter sp.]
MAQKDGGDVMKTVLPLVLSFLVGCVGPPPDYISKRGVSVYLNGVDAGLSPAISDAMETGLVDLLVSNGWKEAQVNGALSQGSIFMVDAPFPCVYEGRQVKCAGVTDPIHLMVTLAKDPAGCAGHTAYRHELLHLLQAGIEHYVDYEHARPEWAKLNAETLTCEGAVQ